LNRLIPAIISSGVSDFSCGVAVKPSGPFSDFFLQVARDVAPMKKASYVALKKTS
jgi:hypothetical protein